MGAPESMVRTDGKAGSVDLSLLAEPVGSWERPEKISLRTATGLWYELSPLEENDAHPGTSLQPDNTIYPVNLEFGSWARISGSFLEETRLAIWGIKKWVTESRHFRVGPVALMNSVITEGDRLTIDGRRSGPVDVAWVTEWIDPASGIRTSSGMGKKLETGEWIWTRTVAHF